MLQLCTKFVIVQVASRAAAHSPLLSADNVGCHFDAILSADGDRLCGVGATCDRLF